LNPFRWDEAQIFAYFFAFIRVGSLMIFIPLYGERAVPAQVKVLLSVALAWVLFPLLWSDGLRIAPSMLASPMNLTMAISQEVLFGALIGLVSRWAFDVAQIAGQLAGTAMGLSMASVVDPHTEAQTLAISEVKHIMALLLFLAMDGHVLLLQVIKASFSAVPPGSISWFAKNKQIIGYLTEMSAEVLLASVKIASPVICASLLVNVTFGIVSRAVPQMNIFAVSFGASIMVGLFITVISLPGFTNAISGMFVDYGSGIVRFMELFHG
jgi:flagellar biosynthetic protein FliR